MLDSFLERLKKVFDDRYVPIIAVYTILFAILIVRIFNIQIAQNDKLWSNEDNSKTKVRELKSARGNILDSHGVVLAYNELSYSITLEDTGELKNNEEKNAMIYKLISIIEKYGGELANDFFIKQDKDGNLYFESDGKEELRFKRDAYSKRSVDDLTQEEIDATAQDVYEYLRTGKGSNSTSMFFIDDKKYTTDEILKIMQIRYYLMLNKFEKYNPITVATNVDSKTVAAINEYSSELIGVDVLSETYRVYNESEIFAHMMGYTGLITNDELEEYNAKEENAYSATDQVGKTGLEEYLEKYLHGEKGSEEIKINEDSEVESIKQEKEPVAGDDVYLTIDSNLQKASYTLLEKELASIILGKLVNRKTVGTYASASDIEIPVYDIYYAFVENNVIDLNHLSSKDAKTYEKSAYKKYLEERKDAKKDVKNAMSFNSTKVNEDYSDTIKSYLDRIYEILDENGVLLKDSIDTDDETYQKYQKGNIALSQFLQYAFENGWISMQKLNIDVDTNAYYSTEELYKILIDYVMDEIEDDSKFTKLVYRSMVESGTLSASNLCIILMEQDVLPYNKDEVAELKSGSTSAYSYVTKKLRSLDITPGQLALDPCSGSVVVTDVKSGDVLAMVSYPSYDNNKLANSIDSDYYSKLLEDESDVLVNRATLTRTAPGSTFKMVTAAAGLEEGVLGRYQRIYDKLVFKKVANPPKCYAKSSHGDITVVDAIGVSCNYFFYEVGFQLSSVNGSYDSETGLATIKKYASKFGFNAKSGVEVAEYNPKISDEDAVRSAIGQGSHAFAPIQIARYVTSLANGGNVYNLTLVDKVVDGNDKVILNNKADVYNKVELKDSTWDAIHQGMYTVVNGPKSSIKSLYKDMDITVAGKTGTAQQVKTRPSHALFVSYAPFDDPKIAVTCVIPFGYGSYNAADLAQQIYQYYFELTDTDALLDSDVNGSNVDTSQQD